MSINPYKESMFSLGVFIRHSYIIASLFDSNHICISSKQIHSQYPLTPGLTAVSVCELVESIDQDKKSGCIGITLNALINKHTRLVSSFDNSKYWVDVPLADWIEARLERNVYLVSQDLCNVETLSNATTSSRSNNDHSVVFFAASFALDNFKNHLLSF